MYCCRISHITKRDCWFINLVDHTHAGTKTLLYALDVASDEGRTRDDISFALLKRQLLGAFNCRSDAGIIGIHLQPVACSRVGISLLLTLITLMLVNGRELALQAVSEMNRELIERETRYRQM